MKFTFKEEHSYYCVKGKQGWEEGSKSGRKKIDCGYKRGDIALWQWLQEREREGMQDMFWRQSQ